MMGKKRFPRILKPPPGSFFLFGPRGVGKTTWLRKTFPDALWIDLLDESLFQSYLRDIGGFAGELRTQAPGSLVIVDEIQRLPALLNDVHRFMEERQLLFALCGSSARKLKTSGTNLLAGRAVRLSMHPLLPEELGRAFSIEDALRFGTLAVIQGAPDRKGALAAYVQMYMKEEIQAEALVRNLAGFARFLPIAALFHGQVLNVSGLARDAGVARTSVAGYLGILEDTLLAFRLPAYEARLRVRERKHPKLYWTDPGLVRAAKGQFGPVGAEERGALFEGWVAALLRAYGDHRELFDEWFYWAPGRSSGVEVDFLLRKDARFVAVEVKASSSFSRIALRGLRAVRDLEGLGRRILLHLGDRRQETSDGIDVLPLRDFLALLETGSLFD